MRDDLGSIVPIRFDCDQIALDGVKASIEFQNNGSQHTIDAILIDAADCPRFLDQIIQTPQRWFVGHAKKSAALAIAHALLISCKSASVI